MTEKQHSMTCLVTRTEDFIVHRWISLIDALQYSVTQIEQARKSSEHVQAAGYAQFEKVWAG